MAQPFDARGLRLTGDAFVVAKGVQHLEDSSNAGVFSLSETGLLAYAEGGPVGFSQLTIFDRSGKALDALGAPGNVWTPHLSRDGRRVTAEAIDPVNNNRDVVVFDVAGGGSGQRATFDPADDLTPSSRRTAAGLRLLLSATVPGQSSRRRSAVPKSSRSFRLPAQPF